MAQSEAKKKMETTPPETTTGESLPLFFKKPVQLDIARHAKAGLVTSSDATFAATTNSIVLNAVEFFEATKNYPIVFTQTDNPMPVAIVGLEQGNYFVDAKGSWKEGAYVPAYVRKYPFIFLEVPDRDQLILCIDEDAPQFKENGGKDTVPLYKDSEPSELTKNALEFCGAYHSHYQLTRQFCDALKEVELLTPTRSDSKLANGREIHLGGFLAIDEKKLNELPEAKVLEFFKKGWLSLIYAALMSTSNWNRLVEMAAAIEKKKAN